MTTAPVRWASNAIRCSTLDRVGRGSGQVHATPHPNRRFRGVHRGVSCWVGTILSRNHHRDGRCNTLKFAARMANRSVEPSMPPR